MSISAGRYRERCWRGWRCWCLPGQGLLTIFVAIMLLDFPGKRRLQRWLICRRPIFRSANWVRAKRHQPPLELPPAGLTRPGQAGR